MQFDKFGREIPDPTPVEVPAEFRRPESMDDKIRRMISGYMSQQAVAEGRESFEEANDFETDDPDDFVSPYEVQDMHEEVPIERFNRQDSGAPGAGAASSPRGSDSGGRVVERARVERSADRGAPEKVRESRSARPGKDVPRHEGKRGANRERSGVAQRPVQRDIDDSEDHE